jgi:hypothetical protein
VLCAEHHAEYHAEWWGASCIAPKRVVEHERGEAVQVQGSPVSPTIQQGALFGLGASSIASDQPRYFFFGGGVGSRARVGGGSGGLPSTSTCLHPPLALQIEI